MVYLRDRADTDRIRNLLVTARSVVVVGGGFVGLEAASMARKAGKTVTVVEAADRLLNRSASSLVSDYFLGLHIRHGTTVRTGAQLIGLEGSAGRVREVHLADGEVLPAEVLVVGIGGVPRLELATRIGLQVAGGIVVDEAPGPRIRPSSRPVTALLCHSPTSRWRWCGSSRFRTPKTKARRPPPRSLGESPPNILPPRFWSDQYGVKVQTVGLVHGYDHLEVDGDPDADRFAVRYYRRGALVALDAVNAAAQFARARRMLSSAPIPGGGVEPVSLRRAVRT